VDEPQGEEEGAEAPQEGAEGYGLAAVVELGVARVIADDVGQGSDGALVLLLVLEGESEGLGEPFEFWAGPVKRREAVGLWLVEV
jgi:hypothetical protein